MLGRVRKQYYICELQFMLRDLHNRIVTLQELGNLTLMCVELRALIHNLPSTAVGDLLIRRNPHTSITSYPTIAPIG
jgi:hypothetical protein